MTEPDAAGMPIKDFTIRRDPHRFKIDDDVFAAPPILSTFAMRKLADLHSQLGDIGAALQTDDGFEKIIDGMSDMFRVLLPGEHGRRFVARLRSDGNPGDPEADPPIPPAPAPVDLVGQVLPVVYWLLECYGLRPTVPSSPSSDGSTDGQTATLNGGISSTAGASPEASVTTDLDPADWLDLVHAYLLEFTEPEKQVMITRALTGELGTWAPLLEARRQPTAPPAKPKLRPPPWSRIPQADIERMERARAAAAQANS